MSTEDPFALGRHIGGGCSREVYVSARWPSTRVVKVTPESDSDFNRAEWLIWTLATPEARKLLAPCYAISDDGTKLLMRRTKPATVPELWKFKAPQELSADLHRFNLGKILGRVVIHDYAGWDRTTEERVREMMSRLTEAGPRAYRRPRSLDITPNERKQYGLA